MEAFDATEFTGSVGVADIAASAGARVTGLVRTPDAVGLSELVWSALPEEETIPGHNRMNGR